MKTLQQHFHIYSSFSVCFLYVNIQMKPLQQYFHVVLFVLYVVLTFESVEKCFSMNIK